MTHKSLRLLFVAKSLAVPGGGAERVLAEVTSALAERGHDVTVASFDREGSEPFYRFNEKMKLLRLGIGQSDKGSGPIEIVRRARGLRRLAVGLRTDVAVGFMHSAYVPLALGLAGTGIRGVASEHIVYSHYSDRPLERFLLLAAGRLLAATTAISDKMRDGFPEPLRTKMRTVPNPVRVFGSQRDGSRRSEAKTLLSIGRLEKQKDQATLIEAFAKLARDFPDWKLRIIGEGSLRPDLESKVAALGLPGRVELPGAVADIEREFAAADLFAMPSLYESFGIATAEALAAGLPAVGFADCPGTNELIDDGVNGALVSGADRAGALADGLARLMRDDNLRARLGEAGPASVEKYSLASVADRWEQLLSDVAQGKKMADEL